MIRAATGRGRPAEAGPLASNPAARAGGGTRSREKKCAECGETIEPKQMAQLIMRTREQLAAEISYDLRALVPDASPASVANMAARPAASMSTTTRRRVLRPVRAPRDADGGAHRDPGGAGGLGPLPQDAPRARRRRPATARAPPGGDGGALRASSRTASASCSSTATRSATTARTRARPRPGSRTCWTRRPSSAAARHRPAGDREQHRRIRGELAAAWAEAIVDDVKGEHAVLRREISSALVAE
ncbi:hypothetical protein JL720_4911 [Aureococcus anophagefferens]|nr:hypothetical protein JL720_4911 [Aureococcus anophagefferens]